MTLRVENPTAGLHERPAVLLVLPLERWSIAQEVARCRSRYGVDEITLVWCGDPQLRPAAPLGTVYSSMPDTWELVLLSSERDAIRRHATEHAIAALRSHGATAHVVDVPEGILDRALCIPGGTPVDDVMRRSVASALRSGRLQDAPPSPWQSLARFRSWLGPRYEAQQRALRLGRAVEAPGLTSGVDPTRLSVAVTAPDQADTNETMRLTPDGLTVLEPLRQDGFNLVGYLTLEMSLGDVARRLGDSAVAAGLGVARIAHLRAASPALDPVPDVDQEIRFETTVAVVTADQFHFLAGDYPTIFNRSKRLVGYWFWELEHIPQHMIAAMSFVDEIWAGSRFVTDNFAAVTDKPVRYVPIPIPKPTASLRDRSTFPLLRPFDDRLLFLVVFDYYSIMERKNPIGAIEAFQRAFDADEGPVLIVKSMHANERPEQRDRVAAAAFGRSDIILWDEHLSRPDQMALLRAADCLVSLHRSEGLGLHLAEAMWLGTPTIATRYSGNLDFQDDQSALLVDATQTPVRYGEGIYPEHATWADPDLDQAASFMRRLAQDEAFRCSLGAAANARMQDQTSAWSAITAAFSQS